MKNKILKVITVLLCIAVTVCGYFIYNLSENLESTRTNCNHRIDQMHNEIQSIYANVDRMLEEKASIISSENYEFGKMSTDNHTVELICTVTPKEYITGKTKAEIYINSRAYSMTENNGSFSAIVSIPLFEESKTEKIVFTEDDTVRTQETVQYFLPKTDYLPDMSVSFTGSYSNTNKNRKYIETVNGNLDICIYGQTDNLEIVSLDLIEASNGKELSRKPISSFENAHPAKESFFASESIVAVPDMSSGDSQLDYSVKLNRNFEIPFGEHLVVYVEMKDSNGLVYRSRLFSRSISDTGALLSNNEIEGSSFAEIYSADGKLLYSEGVPENTVSAVDSTEPIKPE